MYKYTKEKYAKSLVEDGIVYISALSSFHGAPSFNLAIGDYQEGKVKFTPKGQPFDTADPNHNKSLAHQLSSSIKAERIIIFSKEIKIHTNNTFVYSVSKTIDKETAEEFGYDACIKIEPFEDFYRTLTDCLIKSGLSITDTLTKDCLYIDSKHFTLADELPDAPVFLKDKLYKYQQEVRSVWTIKDLEDKSFVFNCPDIKKFCSVIKI